MAHRGRELGWVRSQLAGAALDTGPSTCRGGLDCLPLQIGREWQATHGLQEHLDVVDCWSSLMNGTSTNQAESVLEPSGENLLDIPSRVGLG